MVCVYGRDKKDDSFNAKGLWVEINGKAVFAS